MKRALLFLFVMTLGANCASRTTSQVNNSAIQKSQSDAQPTAESAKTPTADNSETTANEQVHDVPTEFKGVDFKNFAYPISYGKGRVRLKDGSY